MEMTLTWSRSEVGWCRSSPSLSTGGRTTPGTCSSWRYRFLHNSVQKSGNIHSLILLPQIFNFEKNRYVLRIIFSIVCYVSVHSGGFKNLWYWISLACQFLNFLIALLCDLFCYVHSCLIFIYGMFASFMVFLPCNHFLSICFVLSSENVNIFVSLGVLLLYWHAVDTRGDALVFPACKEL